ncbi:MAG TPA: hypothetical protein VJZ71_03700 [Phycisphaerae bacterium]|nr:hypothetical protein [Phycisphaerae bacterium]
MNVRHDTKWWIATALTIIGIGLCGNKAMAQPVGPGDAEQGVDVLTRGPVHEAFAETVSLNPEPGLVVAKAPREIIEEVPPDQRPEGANVTWIPGYWAWDDERDDFLWISGVWRDLPPGRQWVPGYWGQSNQGHQWTSGYWADAGVDEVEYLPEPPDSVEIGPNIVAPAPNLVWVPGSWIWYHGRYAWRPGYWAAGRPNWMWVPAHYIWAPRGYVYSDGYWDYPVERRGVLFAPVCFEREVYSRRGYSYSPSFAINLSVFSDQLFVRPRYHHYYFGDYYDTRYESTGFFASFSYHSSRYGYDPIYAHRRWEHRGDRDWDRRDRDTFAHRRDYVDARPARTLRAQREFSTRPTRSGESRIEVASAFNLLTKRKDGSLRFQKVDQAERTQLSQRGRAIQNTRGERQRSEIRTAVPPNEKNSRVLEPARAKLPKPTVVSKPVSQYGKGQAPPKRHIAPQPDPKVEPKARRTDGQPVATRAAPARKADPPTNVAKAQPKPKRPDLQAQPPRGEPREKKAEPKRDPPREQPKQNSKGKSDEKPKDEKKPKDKSKGKP